MHKLILSTASACVLASTLATAQTPPSEGSLGRARALFEKVDLDDDGSISAREAGRAQIPSQDFVSSDADRDRRLSGEEFVIFYRQLLVRAGKDVSADLEAEAARIQAARRARESEKARKRLEEARQAEEAEQGAQETREKVVQERTDAARGQKPAQDEERAVDAREREAQREAERIAAAREEALRERGEAAREQQAQEEAARIAAAREKALQERADAARAQEAREQERPRPAAGKTPEERAQAYVVRLVEGGRLTTEQARDFYAVLLAKAGQGSPVEADALQKSLERAKDRIGDLVRKGALSAEEGRQLASTMDARARAVARSGGVAGDDARRESAGPAEGRRGVVEPPRPRGGEKGDSGEVDKVEKVERVVPERAVRKAGETERSGRDGAGRGAGSH